jgi:DNA-directed RNA polymerase subunit beta'
VPKGKAPLVSDDGVVTKIENKDTFILIKVKSEKSSKKKNKVNEKDYLVSKKAKLLVKEGDVVKRGDKLVEGPMDLREVLAYRGIDELRNYIIKEIQKVYFPVGSVINDRYIEVIVRQMFSRVQIKDPGDSDFIEGQIVDKSTFLKVNEEIKKLKGKPAKAIQKVIGIKKVALTTESFLSAASFQETSRVLVEAATEGKIDYLRGLKENVIIGKLIPAGTGLKDLSFLKKNLTNEENNVNL